MLWDVIQSPSMRKAETVKNTIQIIIKQTQLINSKYMPEISYRIVILLALATLLRAVVFNKEVNSADPKALCLNGAQSFIYTSNHSSSVEGIIVYFMPTPTPLFCGGDSLSSTLDNCVTVFDEVTSYWGNQLTITNGILADPNYEAWAKIIIPACDGALFQGFATNPTPYKGKNLYFRGNRVVKSNLDHIFSRKFNASKITQFVFAGSGYGANGALIWSRYFYDEIVLSSGKNKHFSLILDSIPFSFPSLKTKANEYEIALQNMLKIANNEELTPFILCTLRNEGEEWRCFKLEETYYYLNFPVFWVDTQYDSISLQKILETNCVNKTTGSLSSCTEAQLAHIAQFRSSKIVKMYSFMNFNTNSAWSVGCSTSSLLNSERYNSDSWTANDAKLVNKVKTFLSHSQTRNLDRTPWPANSKCSGLN